MAQFLIWSQEALDDIENIKEEMDKIKMKVKY